MRHPSKDTSTTNPPPTRSPKNTAGNMTGNRGHFRFSMGLLSLIRYSTSYTPPLGLPSKDGLTAQRAAIEGHEVPVAARDDRGERHRGKTPAEWSHVKFRRRCRPASLA